MVKTTYRLKEKYRNWNVWQGYGPMGRPLNDFVGNMGLSLRVPASGFDVDLPDLQASISEHMRSDLAVYEGKIIGGSRPPTHTSGPLTRNGRVRAPCRHRKG